MQDQTMMNYMCVPGTDGEVGAMDDLQFMDALLDSDGNFVETTESGDTQQLSSVDVTSSNLLIPQHLHQHQQPLRVSNEPRQQQTSNYNQEPPQTAVKCGTEAKPPEIAITPSPLAARMNYQYQSNTGNLIFPVTSNVVTSSLAPPISYMNISNSTLGELSSRKRPLEHALPVSEDESDKQRRRMDRNLREQQRSHKITDQICVLRDILAGANVHFKPDKHSTLVSVVEYIKQLQTRSQLLDSEHKNLLDTISKTNKIVNGYHQTTADGETLQVSNDLLDDGPPGVALEEEYAVFVRHLDYKNVFKQCGIALAVASIDGRFIDCNEEFEKLTGYGRDELLPSEPKESNEIRADSVPSKSSLNFPLAKSSTKNLSLFNLLDKKDMQQVFLAMSRMLKKPLTPSQMTCASNDGNSTYPGGCWSGNLNHSRNNDTQVTMNVSLVRSPLGRPKFFQCSLTPELEPKNISVSTSSYISSLRLNLNQELNL